MSQGKKDLVSVTLSAENWTAIQALLRAGCKQRGGDWVVWGEGISAQIQRDIDAALHELDSRAHKVRCRRCGSDAVTVHADDFFWECRKCGEMGSWGY